MIDSYQQYQKHAREPSQRLYCCEQVPHHHSEKNAFPFALSLYFLLAAHDPCSCIGRCRRERCCWMGFAVAPFFGRRRSLLLPK